MKKLSKLKMPSDLTLEELSVIRGGQLGNRQCVSYLSGCGDCCGTCDAISQSGRSAGISGSMITFPPTNAPTPIPPPPIGPTHPHTTPSW